MKHQPAPLSFPHAIAWIALALLLLMLGLRLTSGEVLRETLAAKSARLAAEHAGQTADSPQSVPFVGPTFTAAYAALACFLAGIMTFVGGRLGALTRFRLGQLAMMGLLMSLAMVSALHADNHFDAVIGASDLLASLAAAWIVLLACHERVLGPRGRQAIIAAFAAILTLGVAKALMQQFIEFPETAEMVKQNPDKVLRENGINPDNASSRKLFMARLASSEVFAYGGLSNVFATQMIADVALLAGLGLAGILFLRRPASPELTPKKRGGRALASAARDEIPVHLVALAAVAILFTAGLGTLPFTGSKGGLASAALALAAIILGGIFWRRVARHRRAIILAATAAALLLPVLVLGYGITHHALPTRSLLFRWQYWTGAWGIFKGHALWGVGLNNFGPHYLQFKLPAWPEEVTDPHSFFVRYAAEIGLPAAVTVAILLVWMIRASLPRPIPADKSQASPAGAPGAGKPLGRHFLLNAGVIALAWVPLHFLTEASNEYNIIVALLMAVLAWAVFAAAMVLQAEFTPRGFRFLALTALAGALAMLLYDQVNMALVTGPVAMLFWMLLAAADARAADTQTPPLPGFMSLSLAAALAFIGVVITACLLVPLAQDAGPGDPAPFEFAYLRAMDQGRWNEAQAALNAAIERSPGNIELLTQRVELRRGVLHLPVAADIRGILQLDRSNAAIRLLLAIPDTDLPPEERRRALLDALAFNQQLEPQEPKRLTPLQLARTREALARLPAYAWFHHP